MSVLLNNLFCALKANDEEQITSNLKDILTIQTQGTEIEISDNTVVKSLLKVQKHEILKLSTEVIAEWAKSEMNRKKLTDEDIMSKLMTLLDQDDDVIVFNTVRALGNICYANEEACDILDKLGITNILKILKEDDQRKDNSLTTKITGLLLNTISIHDGLARTALRNDIIPVLENLLEKYWRPFEDNQILLTYLLSLLNSLSDDFEEMNIVFSEKLFQIVIDIFKISTNLEICVTCLEMFHGQSERDEIKTLLAKGGVCELIFELIKKYEHQVCDDESRSVLKMVCDIIVVVLTGDDCMNMLYNNGKGKVYRNMVTWLNSDDSDLLSTGVLAIGNFARKEAHCVQMVNNGISKKLLDILTEYNTSTNISDIKIQHALLSTLRNLLIPYQTKAPIVQEGLIEVIYPMIQIDQYFVVFKLLGTFRMAVDGQESVAMDLISRVDFLERLVYWCYNSDHLGVRGEVPRLLAWLIKNCHSFKPFEKLISVKDTVRCIVEMMTSNYALMQNEAFYSLNLLFVGCSEMSKNSDPDTNDSEKSQTLIDKLVEEVIKADIGKYINFVVNKYGEKMDKRSVDNLVALLEHIVTFESAVQNLRSSNVTKALEKISLNPNVENATEKLDKVITALSESE